jgi:H+-transporting ATPase
VFLEQFWGPVPWLLEAAITIQLALGAYVRPHHRRPRRLGPGQLQTLAFVTLVFGSQALVYVVRGPRHLWGSRPGVWVLAASAADVSLVCVLASSGMLMAPLSWSVLAAALAAAGGFALVLDQIKRPVMSAFGVWQA